MGTLDEILNVAIPIAVTLFLIYTIYRIPVIKELVGAISNKIGEMRERRENSSSGYNPKMNTIQYE